MNTLGLRSVYRLGTPSRWGESLDRSYVRTNGRTNEESFSPTRDTSSSVTRTPTYGFLDG